MLLTGNMTWEKVQTKGDIPAGVAAHSAVALGNTIYIFGGITLEGASNSMYKFNTGKVCSMMRFTSRRKMYINKPDSLKCICPVILLRD